MSTRCNIVLTCGETRIFFYRHYDGYPSDAGKNVATVALLLQQGEATLDDVVRDLLKDYGCEVTTDLHGDVEYVYYITPTPDNTVVGFAERGDADYYDFRKWAHHPRAFSAREFLEFCEQHEG
jgi:hypothetical protein